MKKLAIILGLMTALSFSLKAQETPKAPELEFAFEIKVKCDQGYSCGKNSRGERFVIPILSGTFEGPAIKGEVLQGGADYQLIDKETGRTELEAIYCIRTDDGVNIHVRNRGILYSDQNGFYFKCSPVFEAPKDSKYDWLNNAIFICDPGFGDGLILLKMWKVKQ